MAVRGSWVAGGRARRRGLDHFLAGALLQRGQPRCRVLGPALHRGQALIHGVEPLGGRLGDRFAASAPGFPQRDGCLHLTDMCFHLPELGFDEGQLVPGPAQQPDEPDEEDPQETEDPPLRDRPTGPRHGVVVGVDIVPITTVIRTRRRFSRCIHGEPPVTRMVAAARVVEEHTCMLWMVIATGVPFVKDGPTRVDEHRKHGQYLVYTGGDIPPTREGSPSAGTPCMAHRLDIMTSDGGRLTPDVTRVSLPEARAA